MTDSGDKEKETKPLKSRRASRPKVKTGCNNCKNRRVKCDETRPQCIKCVRSGRHCDGYPAYKRTVEVAVPIAPRPDGIPSTAIAPSYPASYAITPAVSKIVARKPRRPLEQSRPTPPPTPIVRFSPTTYAPTVLPFDAQEGQYFQVFRTHTASELSGFFDSEFWTRSVLQESHSEASIRHAVVALGALYKTLEKSSESPPSSPDSNSVDTAPNHYNFALQQYGKALARLREALQNNETRSQRTILISVVLFTCFESFTGNHTSAISQIQHGLGLLEERRQQSRQQMVVKQKEIVEDELVQMFTRLAIQAKSYDMAFHFPPPYVIRLTPAANPGSPQSPTSPSDAASTTSVESAIPDMFRTSQEARASLDSLCERIMQFQEGLSSYYQGPNNILPQSLKASGLGFRTQLAQWAAAFEPLLESRRRPKMTNTERAGIDVLKMMQLMTSILFLMGFSTSEMDFDNHMPQFKEIIDLAKEVVVDEELMLAQSKCGSPTSCRHRQPHNNGLHFSGLTGYQPGMYRDEDDYTHIKASFALDLGIVPPLFVVATKCRDRKLRRDAIKLLLNSPRREGMWDSILSGRVGQWIMEIEEEGMGEYLGYGMGTMDGAVVPQDRRVMVKEILFNMQSREATLRCGTRGARDGDYDLRTNETHITW
ncbi:Zn2/Cys6 DNA-binding protein [Glarea lozoyensis ATCC 20868]|uniref:Zn2/Cys6 DNA-binding protein n=1 Tax=Glarea lozoyensis (strain ATCC 20868 / MF5171) TaxID=1116229 RepID=S3DFU6_GLAL2|nr:Zn2/Cys6 DNA-binding protein [Glarea lozoyensis ATCC 20868]EPE30836.1 Zn2/Cys6 DNA-binding protein [Glarea lozoyensis ATCC 20868]